MNARRQHHHTARLVGWGMAIAFAIPTSFITPALADDVETELPPAAASTSPDDAPQDADAGKAENENEMSDDELLDYFRVSPNSFNINSHVHFDDDGNVRNEQNNMGLNLNVFYDPAFIPRSYRNLTIDSMVTDTGEELNHQHRMTGEQIIHHHQHGHQSPRFSVNIQVTPPKQPANRIRRVVGSIEVSIPMGEPRHAVLSPIKEVLGKRVHIANFPGSELQFSFEQNNNRSRLQMNAELASLLTDVRFFRTDDQEVHAQSRGTGRHGDRHQQFYQLELPEDGKIMLTFRSENRTLRIPFELEDIPLPHSGNGGGADLVIRAELGDPVVQNAGPGDGDLEVRIE
ncbi:hypothetical protein ACERK3_01965 [Phycisphaerales bacterium AB-hyl4]|uniref:Secreted protein n=1 Tax=Natronomicrosphaera hydrolytica TaxID=3242702 RepID=A0ABV4U0I4_9BACT